MQVEQMIEQATHNAVVQSVQAMQTAAIASAKIVAETTNAICKQLQNCQTVEDLAHVIETLQKRNPPAMLADGIEVGDEIQVEGRTWKLVGVEAA